MKPFETLDEAKRVLSGNVYTALKNIQDTLKDFQVAAISPDDIQLLNIAKNENVTHDGAGSIVIEVGLLKETVQIGTMYIRENPTLQDFEKSLDGVTWFPVGNATGVGDMTKDVYDADHDGIVEHADEAALMTDGTNTVTPAEVRDHLDNHPSGGGDGDMQTSVYDGDADGVVDAAAMITDGTDTVYPSTVTSHIADGNAHKDTTDHTAMTNIGTNSHAQIDSHMADTNAHKDTTDHAQLSNIGTNSHGQLDAHLADASIHGGGGAAVSVLRGDGLSSLAQVTNITRHRYDKHLLTLFGQVAFATYGQAMSFFKLIGQDYGNAILDFGVTSGGQLYVTQGNAAGTQVSTTQGTIVITDADCYIPLEVACMIDRLNNRVAFSVGGNVDAWQVVTYNHVHDPAEQKTIILGDAFNGDLCFFGICAALLCPVSSYHTPLQKGFGFGQRWVSLWDMHEGEGTEVGDIAAPLNDSGYSPYDLTLTGGTWVS